jgi:hypothetical protein
MKHVVHDDADRIDGLDQLAARFRQARELAAQSRAGAADMQQQPEVAAAARQLADDLDRFADKYEPILRRLGATES